MTSLCMNHDHAGCVSVLHTQRSAASPKSPNDSEAEPLPCFYCNLWPRETTGHLHLLLGGALLLGAHSRVYVCCQGSFAGGLATQCLRRFFVSLSRRA